MTSSYVRVALLGEDRPDAELSKAIRHFGLDSSHVVDRGWRVEYPTDLHVVAFIRATAALPLSVARERPTDPSGWENWSDAGAGHVEPTGRLLPDGQPADKGLIYRFVDSWAWEETAPSPAASEAARLGLVLPQGKGTYVWKALKLGWRLAGALDLRDDIAFWIAGQVAKKIQREVVEYRAYMSRFEAEQRLILEVAAERHVRLNSGTAAEKAKWRHHYAIIDKLIALG